MVPVQSCATFKSFSNSIAEENRAHPQDQENKQEKNGKKFFYDSRPGIIAKQKQPKESKGSTKGKQRDQSCDEKSGDRKQQYVPISLFHDIFRL